MQFLVVLSFMVLYFINYILDLPNSNHYYWMEYSDHHCFKKGLLLDITAHIQYPSNIPDISICSLQTSPWVFQNSVYAVGQLCRAVFWRCDQTVIHQTPSNISLALYSLSSFFSSPFYLITLYIHLLSPSLALPHIAVT